VTAEEDRREIPAREVRFVVVVDDYESAVHLYRDVFGLNLVMDLEGQGGRGVILEVPSATLEIVDADHERMVDMLEAGQPFDKRIRIAVQVGDLGEAARAVSDTGAGPVASPVETPWGDRNQRFMMRDGLQMTLFETGG
jgi:catechol 2,3-dioxygenase-like lactoylglutathione lyase family enzyme